MQRRTGARWARSNRVVVGVLAAASLIAGAACTRPPARAAALESFGSCDAALRWLQDAALARVGPYGLGGGYYRFPGGVDGPMPGAPGGGDHGNDSGGTPPPTAPDSSGTNVQEAGVDEPDIVKNDGRRLLAMVGNRLHVVDLTATPAKVAGTLTLPTIYDGQLLVQGDHALVMSTEYGYGIELPGGGVGPPVDGGPAPVDPADPGPDHGRGDARPGPGGAVMPPYRPSVPRTRLTLVDLADAAKPVVRHTLLLDGSFVDARMVGGRARVVTTVGVARLPFEPPKDHTDAGLRAAQKANEDVIRRSKIEDWLPEVRDDGPDGTPRQLLPCARLAHPGTFSGFDTVSVLSLDLARNKLDTADTVGVTASGQTVYASPQNLYVATQSLPDTGFAGRIPPTGTAPPVRPPVYESRTALHAFGVATPGPASYRASGTVEGSLLSQWSLSEHEGHLRVVTTLGTACGGCNGDQSQLSVLRLGGDQLTVVGQAGGMGKGEAVKAVRFQGDRGYVVTFRQVDPLYVLDLADPAKPAVAGELKVPGYSAYLHPVGEGRVLGVGRDATAEGRVTGTKVSLYDVSDAANPTEVRSIAVPDAYTSVEHTAKAFLWWEPSRLAVVPMNGYGKIVGPDGPVRGENFVGAVGFGVTASALTEKGRVANVAAGRGPEEVLRSAVAGDRLVTVSYSGVAVSDLATLEPRSWVAFPTT